MMPAKILYVIINLEIGGSERQLCALVSGLDRSRFSPHVCCLMGGGPLAPRLRNEGIPLSIYRFLPIDYSRKARAACTLFGQVNKVRRLMRSLRPAIVHAVLPGACITGGLAAWLARVPVLITTRRSLGIYKEGRFFLRVLENIVNIRADAVVANSEAVREDTLRRERIDARKVRVICNGVDEVPPAPPGGWRKLIGREPGGPVICLPANFFPYKGHADFLEAAARVHRDCPDALFVLIGDGRLRPDIERRIRNLGLGGSVLLLGSRPDAAAVMRLCDIIVLSSHEEGFPNVVLEAMAAGRPVVATAVGGVPEAVVDGVTGILVPPRAPGRLAEALLHLLSNVEERERMGERGRERARRLFSMEGMVRAYEELYEDLLNGQYPMSNNQ